LRVWRLCRAVYAVIPYDGFGAAQSGGRWNSKGVYVAYAASSASLAILEYLVHIDRTNAPNDLVFSIAEIPDDSIDEVAVHSLPKNWRTSPPPLQLRSLGDTWARQSSTIGLRVPSVLVPSEPNVLINPRHSRASEIRYAPLQDVVLDPRLIK
jgi:RES domain-containing protein